MNALVTDAKNNGINFLIADINKSDWFFSVPNEAQIRFGLGAIKGINRSVVESIIQSRKEEGPYTDIFNFAKRVPEINQKIFESLIKAGAFDSIDRRRNVLLANVSDAIQYSRGLQDHLGQDALFGEEVATPILKEDFSIEEKNLDWEKSVYGFWVSGHPYEQYRTLLSHLLGYQNLLDLIPQKEDVRASGLVVEVRQVVGKRGAFGIVKIDDGTHILDVLVYSSIWEENKYKITMGSFLSVIGKVKFDDFTKQLSLVAGSISDVTDFVANFAKRIELKLSEIDLFRGAEKIKKIICNKSGPYVYLLRRNFNEEVQGAIFIGYFSGNVDDLFRIGNIENIIVR